MLTGEFPLCPQLCWNVVDVRDVALAHLRAITIPEAKGRYLITNNNMWFLEMCNALRNFYPDYPIPRYLLPNILGYLIGLYDRRVSVAYLWVNLGQVRLFNNNKSKKELLLTYRPLEQTIVDCGRSMIENHLIKKPSPTVLPGTLIISLSCGLIVFYAYRKGYSIGIVRDYLSFITKYNPFK